MDAPRTTAPRLPNSTSGEVSPIQHAYVTGGVAHIWERRTPWYEEELLREIRIEREVRRKPLLDRAEQDRQNSEIAKHSEVGVVVRRAGMS